MPDLLEKIVMTVIGTAAITQKKADELIAEIRDRYKLSEEEGKIFVERLQTLAQESRNKVRDMSESEIRKTIDRLGLVSREEFDRLAARVQLLENKFEGPCSPS
ncbi:phasin family protein [Geobacter sp. SVR]|uniref:phasin family protein n=1 Tax=Geobacter sp. SVR TaxID=2495594 RepID=UPI00143EFABA|nr:phasin family protein [Geobacter sp. SVR]BCS53086.1 hypothetical protein GSVR_13940 [Geobacter sp. SVR]GCF84471.1 hypothetical protein GSbR_10710 [Geobacter sp. SVR]